MYYVTASDKCWKDKMVMVCESRKKAYEVYDLWCGMNDRNRVNIRTTKPYYKGNQVWWSEDGEVIKAIHNF